MSPQVQGDEPRRAFTGKQRLLLTAVPELAYILVRGLGLTWRINVTDRRHLENTQSQHGSALVPFWHETALSAITIYRNTGWHTLASSSFDGELAARCAERFGLQVARGSSSRGGSQAIQELIQSTQKVAAVGFTVDGPRGPRRVLKPGIVIVSARTGLPIVPNALVATPSWHLKTWDRMAIPKPFCRVDCAYGEPIPPPADDTPEAVESTRKLVEDRLNELHDRLEIGTVEGA